VEFFDAFWDLMGRMSPGFLLEDPRRVQSSLYVFFLIIFVAALIAGVVMSVWSRKLSHDNRLHRRLIVRYGNWLGWIGGLGILIIGLRYADVQLFSKRIWTVLDLFALVAVGIHFALYWFKEYPQQRADYIEEERRRRFLPAGQAGRGRRRR